MKMGRFELGGRIRGAQEILHRLESFPDADPEVVKYWKNRISDLEKRLKEVEDGKRAAESYSPGAHN